MPALLRHQQWMLGPSAGVDGEIGNHVARLTFRKPSNGSSEPMPPRWRRPRSVRRRGYWLCGRHDLAAGRLVHDRSWADRAMVSGVATLAPARQPAVSGELVGFIKAPRGVFRR